jgi:hypothetical protein
MIWGLLEGGGRTAMPSKERMMSSFFNTEAAYAVGLMLRTRMPGSSTWRMNRSSGAAAGKFHI